MAIEYLTERNTRRRENCSTRSWIDGTKLPRKRARDSRASVRIGHGHIAKVDDRSKRRNTHHIFEGNRVWSFVVITGSAANTGVAIFCNPIGEAQSWSKVFRIVINGRVRASGIVILSAEQHAHRGIREALRLCSRNEACHSTIAVRVGEERIPAQSGA